MKSHAKYLETDQAVVMGYYDRTMPVDIYRIVLAWDEYKEENRETQAIRILKDSDEYIERDGRVEFETEHWYAVRMDDEMVMTCHICAYPDF